MLKISKINVLVKKG